MELHFLAPDLRRLGSTTAELVACSIWEDVRPMRGMAGLLDWRLAGKLSALSRDGFLGGARGEVLFVPGRPLLPFEKVLVLGLGPRSSFDEPAFKAVVLALLKSLEGLHVRNAVVELPGRAEATIQAERAVELLRECAGSSTAHDAWWLVEGPEAEKRLTLQNRDTRRREERD